MAIDVRINTITSRMRMTDAQTLLSPVVMEAIVAAVSQRLRDNRSAEQQIDSDKSLDSRAVRID